MKEVNIVKREEYVRAEIEVIEFGTGDIITDTEEDYVEYPDVPV